MEHPELILRFAIALLIGVLIGLEREYARLKEDVKAFAGVRTFPLIALLGCCAALITDLGGPWAFAVLAGLVGLLIAISYAIDAFKGQVGMTTEIAAVVVFVCGALAYWDYLGPAAAIAVVTFGFLTLKPQLHRLASRVSSEDMYATLKTSHLFNLMDSRGAVSVTERVGLIARVRRNAVAAARAYLEQRETLGFPFGGGAD